MLAKELDTYLVVLELGDNGYVRFTAGNYPELQSIKIYGGEITDPEPFAIRGANVTGDATSMLIEGITPDKFYTVTGLTPSTPYLYRVKAYYVNGTESLWSSYKEVLLLDAEGMKGDVDGNGKVSIDDVTVLIDYLLAGSGDIDLNNADIDGNGNISIDDVTSLIDYLLSGNW